MRISDWSSDVCSSDLLHDLRVHGTGVAGARRRRRQGFGLVRMQVALRIGEELRAAAGAAEVVVGAVVGGVVRGGCRVDGHAADRVDGLAVGMLVCGPARALRPAVSSSAGAVASAGTSDVWGKRVSVSV